MDETILLPSPNWFLISNFAVSKDGWMVYGGPSKSICVLEPRNDEDGVISGNQRYRAHEAPRAHAERVVSVDISSEFPEKRNFISGSQDGTVKQWTLEKVQNVYKKLKTTHTHEIHYNEKEEVVGVGYSTNTVAITVGCFGNIVKWDLTSNVCRTYSKFLLNFRATCMTCSPHMPYHVAVGTKQGVVFVLDLQSNTGSKVYKIRSQDDEITSMSWCPQFEVLVKKTLNQASQIPKKSTATLRMEAIRNSGIEVEKENVLEQSGVVKNLPEDLEQSRVVKNLSEDLEQSGVVKNLPEDSFDEIVVEEDDMFDIYKDHEADEFGHKKYEPEDILVKIKQEKVEDTDYLAECLKLKDEILKRKNETEPSIESLVKAMDKTHMDGGVHPECSESKPSSSDTPKKEKNVEHSVHPHKHLLATMGRYGHVKIWSKSGKLVASCVVPYNYKNSKNKVMRWPTLMWYKPDTLLLVDSKSQLAECNPLCIDYKNKLQSRVVHSHHKRGLYAIVTDAPRVQTAYDSPESPFYYECDNWSVYTVAQDRAIIQYNMKTKKKIVHTSCGGFVYNIQPCPYDAGKIAVGVGDGAVRVWQTSTVAEDVNKLYPGKVMTYWQNVQGKVLTVAWHPAKENLLAFGTAESRVGIIDTSGKGEKPARVLHPALNGGVYSLSWDDDTNLYACAAPKLFMYNIKKNEAPQQIEVELEGQNLKICSVTWNRRGLLVGSTSGTIVVLDINTHKPLAVAYPLTKMIHMMEWHPQQTSSSNEASPFKDLIVVNSLDRYCQIIIFEYKDTKDGKELSTWKTLQGHKLPVLQVAWNPHRDNLLLSSSQDATIRVWDITRGTCISIFDGHIQHSLGATWMTMPQFESKILSGGGDCCMRLWDYNDFKAEQYEKIKHDTSSKSKNAEKKKTDDVTEDTEPSAAALESVKAVNTENKRKPPKKFMLPIIHKQMNPCSYAGLKRMFQKYVEHREDSDEDTNYDCDFVKIFGTINEVNEMLDMEMDYLKAEELVEGWITLAMFRGQVDSMIQFAAERNLLCPYVLNMTPCVSFKFWKEATQLYVAEIDRALAKGAEDKLIDNRCFGGAVYRKMTTLLSMHDVKGAVDALTDVKLFKEAYILCRLRYMDSIAEQILQRWADYSMFCGHMRMAAICYMALGNLSEAANVLAKSSDQETLSLAADLAKLAGRSIFADHVEKKAQQSTPQNVDDTNELLKDLPSRIEMLMSNAKGDASDKFENGDVENSNDICQ